MVFPPPPYADPPNWNQQHQAHHHHLSGGGVVAVGGRGGGRNEAGRVIASFRPGSTAERARLAKIPPTEHAFKCPRCDSTNTKFCYFNNYSFSQPRHFCKACRRYWTRGGALRNVPVGGSCRRNKRGKSGGGGGGISSRSAGDHRSGTDASSSASVSGAMTSVISLPPPLPITDYRNLRMQIQQFPMILGGTMEPLMSPPQLAPPLQAPLLAPLPSLLYSSFGEGMEDVQDRSKGLVKMEENAQEQLGLARLYLGDNSKNNDMFWGGATAGGGGGSSSSGWATGYFSSFNSSSSGGNNLL